MSSKGSHCIEVFIAFFDASDARRGAPDAGTAAPGDWSKMPLFLGSSRC
jgi:hypothetical protein